MKKGITFALAVAATFGVIYLGQLNEAIQPKSKATDSSLNASPITLVSSDRIQVQERTAKFRTNSNTFEMDAQNPGRRKGMSGTQLDFTGCTFVYEDGSPVMCNFTLELKEYYDQSKMLQANLSTTSDGRMLETAGMVELKAYNANGNIKIDPSSSYSIGFPRNGNTKDDFKLFYGEWRNDELINWKLADAYGYNTEDEDGNNVSVRYKEVPETGEKMEIRSVNSLVLDGAYIPPVATTSSALLPGQTCYIQIVKSELRKDDRINRMDYFNWQLNNGQSLSQWFASNFNPDASMVDDFCENKLRSEITFQVNEDGSFKSFYVSHSSTYAYDQVIGNFLSTMPPLNLRTLMPKYAVDHACILSFSSCISNSQEVFTADFRKKYGADTTATLGEVKAGFLDHYVMKSTQLGWINCDRFVASPEPLVTCNVELANPNCMVAMIFDDYNSILRGQYDGTSYQFTNVKSGEPVRILVVDLNSKQPRMAVIKTSTNTPAHNAPPLHQFKLRELDQVLAPDIPKSALSL
jgi:hypothetical protein